METSKMQANDAAKRKMISIVTGCFNEEDNIEELYNRVAAVMSSLPYDYEHICVDNCSTDQTVKKIKELAANDSCFKLIVTARNFGQFRSPYYGMLQSKGDACLMMTSDLQDPPEMIPEFINKWEQGYKTILAVKPESEEAALMSSIRKIYYRGLSLISEIPLVENATGSGLYDRSVVEILRQTHDPVPYLRGLACEIGLGVTTIPFKQPKRTRGISKNNFFTLYDVAMLGITNHSKAPLRFMTMGGFVLAFLSIIVALFYLVAKLLYWDSFQIGTAPILISIFFFGAIQAFFIGVIGEYIGSIHAHVRNMPMAVEKERVNF
jgi:glycosyltransferase involved in cell wall biosynthesis